MRGLFIFFISGNWAVIVGGGGGVSEKENSQQNSQGDAGLSFIRISRIGLISEKLWLSSRVKERYSFTF